MKWTEILKDGYMFGNLPPGYAQITNILKTMDWKYLFLIKLFPNIHWDRFHMASRSYLGQWVEVVGRQIFDSTKYQ